MQKLAITLGIIVLGISGFVAFGPRDVVFGGGCDGLPSQSEGAATQLQVWYHTAANVPGAWEEAQNCRTVVVAIIDSGLDVNHPALVPHLWVNEAEVNGEPGVDDDGNGCVDDIHGCFFEDGAPAGGSIADENGHGTMMAGIISTYAPRAQIMMLKVGGEDGDFLAAIQYGVGNGATVFSISMGYEQGSPENCHSLDDYQERLPRTNEGIEYALEHGAVIIAAAGNNGSECISYPALDPRVIAVGATRVGSVEQTAAPFSNWGSDIDIAAPGEGIVTTIPTNDTQECSLPQGYGIGDGTSFSAPQVAAATALLLAHDPEMAGSEAVAAILEAASAVTRGGGVGALNIGGVFGKATDVTLTTRPTITCSLTVVNNSAFDFRVSVGGSYIGTVKAGDDLTLPGLAYGEEAHVRLESNSILAICGRYLCEVSIAPATSVVCVGETFELPIEETRRGVRVPDVTCE